MRRWIGLAALAASLNMGACGSDDQAATALVLTVKSDVSELTAVSLRVYPGDADLSRVVNSPLSEKTLTGADMTKPFVINGQPDRELLLVVRGIGVVGGPPLVEHALKARFESGKSLALPVYLARACLNAPCGATATTTCYGEPHAGQCAGSCGPVAFPDVSFEIEAAGEEGNWKPRACGGDGDAGPLGLPDRVIKDGDADVLVVPNDGGTCTNLLKGNKCSLAPQCGCDATKACVPTDLTDPENPTFTCEKPGTKTQGTSCGGTSQCAAGHACIGASGSTACFKFCNEDVDCGSGGVCLGVYGPSDTVVKGYSVCRKHCAAATDCAVGETCINAGAANAFCAPSSVPVPTKPDAGTDMCSLQPEDDGCTSDGQCCKATGLAGHCYRPTSKDGGVPDPNFCTATCYKPSDCTTGCCIPLMDKTNACVTRTTVVGLGGTAVTSYCVPQ